MQWIPRSEILTFEEIERLARMSERFGFDGIRLTGGEPTVRHNITTLVAKLAQLGVDLAMTTNGATLRPIARDLREAGLNRLNVSLDSLDRAKFEQMTRRDELHNVLDGSPPPRTPASIRSRSTPSSSAGSATTRSWRSPSSGASTVSRCGSSSSCRSARPMRHGAPRSSGRTRSSLRSPPSGRSSRCRRGAAPADRWRYLDGKGTVGVIPSVTKPFCGDCDQVRLTADGQFRTCRSRPTSSIYASCCGTALRMPISRHASRRRWAPSGRGTRSTRSTSSVPCAA